MHDSNVISQCLLSTERRNDPNQLEIDELIFLKNEVLGNGAFGCVFKGIYQHKLCAVKVLHCLSTEIRLSLPQSLKVQTEALRSFIRECEYLEKFRHPNVVQHYATKFDPSSELPMLVIELMDTCLKKYYTKKSTCDQCSMFHGHQNSTKISFCFDIVSALDYLHAHKVVHRDLCSDNILLHNTTSCTVPKAKVSDFGMSRIVDPNVMSKSLSALGHRMGYLPKEATLDDDDDFYDSSLDIFSFGVIMLQIFNEVPTIKSVKERKNLLKKTGNTCPLRDSIMQCLQDKKEDRPPANKLLPKIRFHRTLTN